jgi:uncharacterized protein (TIGR00299 family) protein
MKIAYLDCFSGISGDMFIGALLDAGLSFQNLDEKIRGLPFDSFHMEVKREARSQIFGTRFMVKTEGQEQTPRNLDVIRDIIRKGNLSRWVRDRSISIFEELARVEGKIHNKLPGDVHFHEVGAVDSIIDIVGTVYGLEQLGVTSLFVSPLPLGSGFVQTAHGRIPIPAPATTALLKDVPVFDSGTHHEMVTPTGAALVKGLATSFGPMPPMVIEKIGYGVGKRDLSDRPNLARILIGDPQTEGQVDTVVILEANVDDTSPEWLGFLMDRLFDAGALDVIFYPVQMKKNRPGIQIQVMGRPNQKDKLIEIVFRESSTLGIRFRYTQRVVLQRSLVDVESPWGKIQVKKVFEKDGSPFFLPEYEACREVAMKTSRPLREIYYWVMGLNKVK